MAISSAVNPSDIARVVGIETKFENRRNGAFAALPQQVALIGQANTDKQTGLNLLPFVISRAIQAGERYGFGSPLHMAAQQLLPITGDGLGSIPLTVYPVAEVTTNTAQKITVTVNGSAIKDATFILRVGGVDSLPIVVKDGDTAVEIAKAVYEATKPDSAHNIPMLPVTPPASVVTFTAKWKGASGKSLEIIDIGDKSAEVAFVIDTLTPGAGDPDIKTVLDQIKDRWESLVVSCQDSSPANFAAFDSWNEGRWGALVRKPAVVFTGTDGLTVDEAIKLAAGRSSDRTNALICAPGSGSPTFVLAARAACRVAQLADKNPAYDYGGLRLTGLWAGADENQWIYSEKNRAVKAGLSTTQVKDGVIELSDTVTFFNPSNDPTPAYRYVVDIVRLQNIIYNVDVEFSKPEWNGAPLIPNKQPTVNPSAKKPKMAVAAAASIVNSLGLNAIISDPETSVKEIRAEIDASNPKRLNLAIPVSLSGNTNIRSITINWGFFFGTPTIVG